MSVVKIMKILIRRKWKMGLFVVRVANFSHRSFSDAVKRKCFAPVSRRRGSGRFHQVFNYNGSGENLVDTSGQYTVEAGYSPHVHSFVMPFLYPLLCRRSRINYARYLHTKRPGKIKNTNSDREAPPRLHLAPRSLTLRQPHPALHFLSRAFSRALFLSFSTPYELQPYTGRRFTRSGTDAIAL